MSIFQMAANARAWRNGGSPCLLLFGLGRKFSLLTANIQKMIRITIDQEMLCTRHCAKPLVGCSLVIYVAVL
jgi:hypothetical protein